MLILVLAGNRSDRLIADAPFCGRSIGALIGQSASDVPHARVLDSEAALAAALELGTVESAAFGGVLLVDSDAWFSRRALLELSRLSTRASRMIAVFDGSAPPRSDRPRRQMLALYVPRDLARDAFRERALGTLALSDLARVGVTPKRVSGTSLDADTPPRYVRDLVDLAAVEKAELFERANRAMRHGVRIRDPHRVAIRGTLQCAPGAVIDVDVTFEGDVIVETGAQIGPSCMLVNARIGAGAHVRAFSIVDGAVVGPGSIVGPFARIRPGTLLEEQVQIGSFVEVKNSTIGTASRINHLAFVGDATLGPRVTIGAGSITCNHGRNGVARTVIEEGAYVGAGCQLVAPVSIGKGATIGAGSTITENAPPEALTVARARQVTVPGWASRVPRQ